MRKTTLLAILIILFIGIFGFSAFYPQTYRHEIKVPVSVNKTPEHIINAKNLAKWWLPFATGDSSREIISSTPHQKVSLGNDYIEVLESNSVNTMIIAGNENSARTIVLQVTPDNVDINNSSVTLIYKSTLLRKLFGEDDIIKNALASLNNFKTYLGSTKLIYGYDIQRVKVKDTAFIFGSDTVPSNQKLQGTISLYKKLVDFSKEKKAVYNGVRIFHSQAIEGNKVILFAGIGIENPITTNPGDKFQYKGMPGGKNLLVVEYEGKYSEIPDIYSSLKKYIEEHKLVSMAIPFEKFISEGFGFADSQQVKVLVTYPIY